MNTSLPPAPESYRRSHKLLGPILLKLHLSCKHYSELTLVSMDRPLTTGENFRKILHFCLCDICRRVTRQMNSLRMVVRSSVAERENEEPDQAFLDSLRQRLNQIATDPGSSGKPD